MTNTRKIVSVLHSIAAGTVGLLLVLSVSQLRAQAGNEGPNAEMPLPQFRGSLVAEKQIVGGFVPPPLSSPQGVRVYSNGDVVSFRDKTEELLLVLSDSVRAKLIAAAEKVQEGPLVDTNPGQPRCADAPEVYYTIFRSDGAKSFNFERFSACHEFALSRRDGYRLKQILDGLDELRDLPSR